MGGDDKHPETDGFAETLTDAGRAGDIVESAAIRSGSERDDSQDIGDRIGRFRVVRALGAGGMGRVFEARDDDLDRTVAVKLLHGNSDVADERLLQEARALARVSHPNVVAVHEVGTCDRGVFVAMEYIPGRTLRRLFDEEPDAAVRLAALRQAGEGLRAAHAAGLVHRDFKPENALVGDDGRVRVLDFGLAKAAADDAATADEAAESASGPAGDAAQGAGTTAPVPLTALTRTGAVVGTPAYMAPEQWRGEAADARSDQFAFCVSAYEALFGRRPFAGDTAQALAAAVQGGGIEPPPHDTSVPKPLRDAVLRGLAPDPADRHPDMAPLLAALAPTGEGDRRRRYSLRRSVVSSVAYSAIATAIVVAFTLLYRSRSGSRAPRKRDPRAAIVAASHLPPVRKRSLPNDPLHVTVHRLKNGLTVYLSPNAVKPRIEAELVFRAGSSQDPPGASGLDNLLEHMMGNGSERLGTTDYAKEKPHLARIAALYDQLAATHDGKRRAALYRAINAETVAASRYEIPEDLAHTLKALGAEVVNASVSRESSAFWSDIPADRLLDWATLEADTWQHPVFRLYSPTVDHVLDELRSAGGFTQELEAAYHRALYRGEPYARPLGTPADIEAQPVEALRRQLHTWFVPNNAAIVLAGDIDPDDALHIVRRAFSGWQPHALPKRTKRTRRPPPPLTASRIVHVATDGQRALLIAWPTVPIGSLDEDALTVMDEMTVNPGGTGIAQHLLGDSGRVASVIGSQLEALRETGSWWIAVTLRKGQRMGDAIAAVKQVTDALKRGDFSKEELAAAKLQLRLARERNLEDNAWRANAIAHSFVRGESWRHAAGRAARIARITRADVMRVARRYLGGPHVVVEAAPGPKKRLVIDKPPAGKLDLSPGRASPLGRAVANRKVVPLQPRFLYRGRDYTRIDTPRGPLIAAKNTTGDLFSLTLRFNRQLGSSLPRCAALAALSRAGVGGRTAAQRETAWERLGLERSFYCGPFGLNLELRGPSGALKPGLRLLAALLSTPRWTAKAWAAFRAAVASAVDRDRVSESALLDSLLADAALGPKVLQSYREVATLTPAQAAHALAGLLTAPAHITYFGPLSAAGVSKEIEAAFPAPRRAAPVAPPRRLIHPRRTHTLLLDRPGADHADVVVFSLLPRHSKTREFGLSQLLQKYLQIRVGEGVEQQRSLAYTTSAAVSSRLRAPDVLLVARSRPAQVAHVVSLLLGLLQEKRLDADALARAKRAIDQRYRTWWIAPRQVPNFVDRWLRMGFDGDPRERFFEALPALGAKDLAPLTAALRQTPPTIIIVGDLSQMKLPPRAALGAIHKLTPADLFAQ